MCKKPFRRDSVQEFGCGQCLPCRVNRLRLWTIRLVLEATQHRAAFFITLTYNNEHLPPDGSVSPRTLALFLKRLRRRLEPTPIRFYGVGEYGDISWRPHYHLVIFGDFDEDLASMQDTIQDAWVDDDGQAIGFTHVGFFSPESAAYVVSYVCKGLTNDTGEANKLLLAGRHPEFARMSRMPLAPGDPGGMGGVAAIRIWNQLKKYPQAAAKMKDGVPSVLRFDGKLWAIGRYLRSVMKNASGFVARVPRRGDIDPELWARLQMLKEPGAVEDRESRRIAQARKAAIRQRIRASKKGL